MSTNPTIVCEPILHSTESIGAYSTLNAPLVLPSIRDGWSYDLVSDVSVSSEWCSSLDVR
ncbi:hypothetical protein [Nocardia cyriacigeorgica]|uniref:hypothetical protein n=1 Tax=Nocardia cyriacigeorgica TaxID=135487 RepID=UPI001109F39A|nr:hypothetical protein [Nocardia cyriacigeorgica]